MLDAFTEAGIPIDMISACSSGAFIACAYAAGKLNEFREGHMSKGVRDLLFNFLTVSFKGGLFSMDKIEQPLAELFGVQNIEDLKIPVSIVASDLTAGTEVVFTMGNIVRAIQASCATPGLFEPVVWGNKVLIDGAIFNIVPIEAAWSMGPDVVIGIDLAATRQGIDRSVFRMVQGYNVLRWPFAKVRAYAKQVGRKIFKKRAAKAARSGEAQMIDQIKIPNLLSVVHQAVGLAVQERKKGEIFNCNLMLEPNVKQFGTVEVNDKSLAAMYEEGRRCAIEAIPKIRELLR